MSVWRRAISAAAVVLAAGCKDTITVNGRVVNHLGIPLEHANVMIGAYGQHEPAFTGADGRFTVKDVEKPYDAQVSFVPTCLGHMVVYQGLKRSDPVLTVIGALPTANYQSCPPNPWSAEIAGALSGGTGFMAGHLSRVAFSAQDFISWGAYAAADGNFSSPVAWTGRDSVSGDLHALQWQEDANGLPATYTGYGTRPGVVVTAGASLTGQDVALASVVTGQVSGTATVPAGYLDVMRTLGLRLGGYGYLPILEESPTPAASFTYQVPQVSGAKVAVRVWATNAAGDVSTSNRTLAPGAPAASLVLPEAVALLQPPAAATGVMPGARFEWTPFTGGVYIFALAQVYGQTILPQITAVTAATSFASLPRSGVFCGMPCGSLGDQFIWGVSASTRYPTVDAAAGGPIDLNYSGAGAFDADFDAAMSGPRVLYTAAR